MRLQLRVRQPAIRTKWAGLAHAAPSAQADPTAGQWLNSRLDAFRSEFAAALADDLNVSAALAALYELVRELNIAIEQRRVGAGDLDSVEAALRQADSVLGVLFSEDGGSQDSETAEIEAILTRRAEARARRDFAESDRLRDELLSRGIVIEDTPHGARWKRRTD